MKPTAASTARTAQARTSQKAARAATYGKLRLTRTPTLTRKLALALALTLTGYPNPNP